MHLHFQCPHCQSYFELLDPNWNGSQKACVNCNNNFTVVPVQHAPMQSAPGVPPQSHAQPPVPMHPQGIDPGGDPVGVPASSSAQPAESQPRKGKDKFGKRKFNLTGYLLKVGVPLVLAGFIAGGIFWYLSGKSQIVELGYLPTTTEFVFRVKPADMSSGDSFPAHAGATEMRKFEENLQRYSGHSFADIDSVTFGFPDAPEQSLIAALAQVCLAPDIEFICVIKTNTPILREQVGDCFGVNTTFDHSGFEVYPFNSYRSIPNENPDWKNFGLCFIDEYTLLVGTTNQLKAAIDSHGRNTLPKFAHLDAETDVLFAVDTTSENLDEQYSAYLGKGIEIYGVESDFEQETSKHSERVLFLDTVKAREYFRGSMFIGDYIDVERTGRAATCTFAHTQSSAAMGTLFELTRQILPNVAPLHKSIVELCDQQFDISRSNALGMLSNQVDALPPEKYSKVVAAINTRLDNHDRTSINRSAISLLKKLGPQSAFDQLKKYDEAGTPGAIFLMGSIGGEEVILYLVDQFTDSEKRKSVRSAIGSLPDKSGVEKHFWEFLSEQTQAEIRLSAIYVLSNHGTRASLPKLRLIKETDAFSRQARVAIRAIEFR